jgi:hypothetical protein
MKLLNDRNNLQIIILLILLFSVFCEKKVIEKIPKSHVSANVPPDSSFLQLLNRDVSLFMTNRYSRTTSVTVEFLRQAATQSGVAYPKFYLWVIVTDSTMHNVLGQGAIRVAAIEKELFRITDYLTKEDITQSPDSIYLIFPKPVCEKINLKIKETENEK